MDQEHPTDPPGDVTSPVALDRRVVATFLDYVDAHAAVDELSDRRFPVERVMIVGAGLDFVEQVTGRRGYLGAVLRFAFSGAVIGGVVGWLLGLFDSDQPVVTALVLAWWGALVGLLVGGIIGVAMHAAEGGRRDFSSVRTMRASRYDVLVDVEVAQEAMEVLAEAGIPVTSSRAPEPPGS